MKMNMKNNKTMLALLVVAALAMVSVAGVALSNEDSDAASTSTLYLNTGDPVFANQTYVGDVYVYTALYESDGVTLVSTPTTGADVTVSINSTATFTGHVYFGTAKLNSSGQVTTNVIYNDVYLNGVSDVVLQVTGNSASPYTASTTSIVGSTTGAVTLYKGALTIGETSITASIDDSDDAYGVAATSFTGVVTANGVTFDSDYIAGAVITLTTSGSKTTTYLSGLVIGCWDEMVSVNSSTSKITLLADSIPTLTVTGTYTINNVAADTFYVEYAAFIVTSSSTATILTDSELQNDGVFIVDGTVKVKSTDVAPDAIDNNGLLYVSGVIEYTTSTLAYSPIDDGVLCASYYAVNSASTSTTTHYYTTLSKAMAASNNVTVYGYSLITTDVTITNTVTLADGAVLIVGIPDVQIDIGTVLSTLLTSNEMGIVDDVLSIVGLTTDSFEPSYATITVSAGSTFNTAAGDVYVINGKVSVDQDATIADSGITATVKGIKEGTNTLYTNLETALDLASSGDVIELEWYGYIFSDSTIPAGVTVTSGTFSEDIIVVYSGVTLTVNGAIEIYDLWILPSVDATIERDSATVDISLDAAVVDINAGASVKVDYILLGGILNINSGFDNVTADSEDVFDVSTIDVFTFVTGEITYEVPNYTTLTYSIDADSATLNVLGKLDLGSAVFTVNSDSYVYEDDVMVPGSNLAVNVTGTLKSAAFDSYDGYSLVTVSGKYTSTGEEYIVDLVVSGTGSVADSSSNQLSVGTVKSGTAATSFTGVANNVTITIHGAVGYALIYGITADGAISITGTGVKSTEFYISADALYAVEYTTVGTDGVYLTPSVVGYNFLGWYEEDGTLILKSAITGNDIGTYPELYASFELIEYSVVLDYVQNGTWIINGISYGSGGNATLAYSSSGYTAQVVAANGYHLNNVGILLDNKVLANGYTSTLADGQTFSISGSIDKDSQSESTDIVEILLIIITIVVVIMAIVIALRLMRS